MVKLVAVLVGLLICIGKSASFTRRHNNHQLRQFNAGGDAYYVPWGETKTGSAGNTATGLLCAQPDIGNLENADLTCASSGCRLQCNRGYSMEHGRRLYLNCDSSTGTLTLDGTPFVGNFPPCLPQCRGGCADGWACVAPNQCKEVIEEFHDPFFGFGCDAPCQNGGTCIDFIGECNCPEGYTGEVCQTHICIVPDDTPAHATISATNNLTKMKIECAIGFKMKNGLSAQGFTCVHGDWVTDDKQESYSAVDMNCYA
ncbi:protein shifted-like [Palaemon carinicauda]|uniref:protein shifted-like n=1 Tax=Palaemon carinicauda TaxID=392227 RepID=UPI0035B67367